MKRRMTCEWLNCHSAVQLHHLIENGQMAIVQIFQNKKKIFLSVNGQMVIRMTCVWPNGNSAINNQT